MKSRWVIAGIALLAVLSGCAAESPAVAPTPGEEPVASGGAAILEEIPFVELVRQSDRIVVGTVLSLEAAWNADQTSIFTSVRVRVLEVAKGTAADEVTFVFEGGQVGDIAQSSGEGVSLIEGERVVLFLRGESVVGGPQGVFAVVGGKVGEEPLETFLKQVRAAM